MCSPLFGVLELFYPVALRKTKIVYNFGLSKYNRVNSTFNEQVED